jgi:type II secretory pathway pseudopilin PulG
MVKKNVLLVFESLIYMALILTVIFVMMFYYYSVCDTAKKQVLKAEINNLQTALQVYKFRNETYPDTLKELVKGNSKNAKNHWISNKKYFVYIQIDNEGYPIDPYGKRFIYDKDTGTVKSCISVD